jgi:hypothetical protein
MTLKAVRVPRKLEPTFAQAEGYVEKLFSDFQRRPERGTLHVGGERYVIMRCESLYAAWFDALRDTFGGDAARRFIYDTAREIGRSDAASFCERLGVEEGIARLSAGPVHFAHAGWALVDILPDSAPATNDTYFLHYQHPNTFESEIVIAKGQKPTLLRCCATGDGQCEFIMAPADKLDDHEARVRAAWT